MLKRPIRCFYWGRVNEILKLRTENYGSCLCQIFEWKWVAGIGLNDDARV